MEIKGYTYHTSTSNHSFIAMYKYLKDKGVANNKFFLKLYDSGLATINPFKPGLSLQWKARVVKEITINPYYYLREIVRMPEPGGNTRFILNPGNLAEVFVLLNNLNAILLMPRQNGKTMSAIAVYEWIHNFGTTNTKILFGNKVFGDAKLNIARYKSIHLLNPDYVQQYDKRDDDNIEKVSNVALNNSISALSSPMTFDQASKLGRGLTSPLLFWDEVAYVKYFDKVYGSASPVLSKAAETAAKNKRPHSKLFATTPNFLEDATAKYIKSMIDMAAVWTEELYDFTEAELASYVYENSRNDFLHIQYTWRELGLTKEWYEAQCRSLNWDLGEIKKEIDIQWTYASSLSPFDEQSLEDLERLSIDPITSHLIDKRWRFNIYDDVDPLYTYMISCDVASGLGSDNSVISIIDPKTLKTVADFVSNKISLPKFEALLKKICTTWILNGFLVIERNNAGIGIIQHIMELNEYSMLRKRVFYFFKEFESATKSGSNDINAIRTKEKRVRVYGVNTTGPSRESMIDLLGDTLEGSIETLNTKNLFNDIKNLERKKNNKIEHRSGEHDDVLFSWLIAKYASQQSTFRRFFKLGTYKKEQNRTAMNFRKVFFSLKVNESDFSLLSLKAMSEATKEKENKAMGGVLGKIYDNNRDRRERELKNII